MIKLKRPDGKDESIGGQHRCLLVRCWDCHKHVRWLAALAHRALNSRFPRLNKDNQDIRTLCGLVITPLEHVLLRFPTTIHTYHR